MARPELEQLTRWASNAAAWHAGSTHRVAGAGKASAWQATAASRTSPTVTSSRRVLFRSRPWCLCSERWAITRLAATPWPVKPLLAANPSRRSKPSLAIAPNRALTSTRTSTNYHVLAGRDPGYESTSPPERRRSRQGPDSGARDHFGNLDLAFRAPATPLDTAQKKTLARS